MNKRVNLKRFRMSSGAFIETTAYDPKDNSVEIFMDSYIVAKDARKAAKFFKKLAKKLNRMEK